MITFLNINHNKPSFQRNIFTSHFHNVFVLLASTSPLIASRSAHIYLLKNVHSRKEEDHNCNKMWKYSAMNIYSSIKFEYGLAK